MTDTERNNRQIAIWLLVVCALIFTMVVLGGVTRLTRSGLSMVNWHPVMGVLPPMTEQAWQDNFEQYKQFPEYQKINKGMSLDEYKGIFWFEYSHRVLGRLIGLAFLLPFLWFLYKKKIRREMTSKLVIMFLLGGLQGLLGWYMVKSGLVDKPHVSQYRLTAHLSAALLIYGFIFWVALDLLRSQRFADTSHVFLRRFGIFVTASICIMIVSGGFVAGTKAGFVFNTFPKMYENWIPPGACSLTPWYMNFFENMALIQFNHRVVALILAVIVPAWWFLARRVTLPRDTRLGFHLVLAALAMQITLGITTLLYVVPVPLAAAHQAGALLVLTAALYLNHRLRAS